MPSEQNWRKSSHSNSQAGECVEAAAHRDSVLVRDSKDPDGPTLTFRADTWHSLLRGLKSS